MCMNPMPRSQQNPQATPEPSVRMVLWSYDSAKGESFVILDCRFPSARIALKYRNQEHPACWGDVRGADGKVLEVIKVGDDD